MNFLVLHRSKFLIYLENFQSESLGFYFSFILHLFILIFVIGLPNFFNPKTINIPNIIPIEIINISDTTSISEINDDKTSQNKKVEIKEKKFNSSENQEIRKIDVKKKPKIKNEEIKKNIPTKEEIIINEKKKISLELKKEKIINNLNNLESLPTKKIKPKLKPKINTLDNQTKIKSDIILTPKPKPKPEKEFDIASMLKDLRNDTTVKKNDDKIIEKKEKVVKNISEQNNNENAQLSISEIDLLRQQLSSCWIAPAGAVIEKGMAVKVSAKINQNKRIISNSLRIIDTNISKSNTFYGPITESAMRTLLNPECIPLKLPEDKYSLWKSLTITFDYSIMKGY